MDFLHVFLYFINTALKSVFICNNFTRRKNIDFHKIFYSSLTFSVITFYKVDFISPELNSTRVLISKTIYIDNSAPDCKLPRIFSLISSFVSKHNKTLFKLFNGNNTFTVKMYYLFFDFFDRKKHIHKRICCRYNSYIFIHNNCF